MNLHQLSGCYRETLAAIYDDREAGELMMIAAEHHLGLDRIHLRLNLWEQLPDSAVNGMLDILQELKTGKPIQYIIGYTWFGSLKLAIRPGILIPRPETEGLCIMAGRDIALFPPGSTLLDAGTGSGCIAIWMKRYYPYLKIQAADVNPLAIRVAAENARQAGCLVDFYTMDIVTDPPDLIPGMLDALVSNPPYIPEGEKPFLHPNVRCFEPPGALFVPDEDPLTFYRALMRIADEKLKSGGILWMEVHEQFAKLTADLFCSSGYPDTKIFTDIHEKDRFLRVVKNHRRSGAISRYVRNNSHDPKA